MRRHAARWTRWTQWAVAVSIVVAVAGSLYRTLTASPADTLYITLGELRSRAAEAQALADEAAKERLTSTYVQAQAAQLAHAIEKARDDLVKMRAGGRVPAAGDALPLAEQLLALARRLEDEGASVAAADAVRDAARVLVAALLPLERAARPT
jgi:hypothetical protein